MNTMYQLQNTHIAIEFRRTCPSIHIHIFCTVDIVLWLLIEVTQRFISSVVIFTSKCTTFLIQRNIGLWTLTPVTLNRCHWFCFDTIVTFKKTIRKTKSHRITGSNSFVFRSCSFFWLFSWRHRFLSPFDSIEWKNIHS